MSDLKTLTPGFIVYINGTRLGVEHEASVKRIVVKDRLDGPAGFAVYLSDMDREWLDSEDFSEGNSISIHLGYKDDIEEIMEGEVTGISTELKKNATAMTVVKGRNIIHRLKSGVKSRVFTETTIGDIIDQVASDNGMSTDVDPVGGDAVFWVQRDQSDYDLVMALARRYNCKVWGSVDTLFFKQVTESTDDVVLEWGKTLLEFSGNTETQNLITEVEVCGWDDLAGAGIIGTSSLSDIAVKIGDGQLGGEIVEENFGARKVVLTDSRVIDQDSADTIAMEYISRNSFNFVSVKAKCEGDYRIKAGIEIELIDVGGRFSGAYLVSEVTHSFQSSVGYHSSLVLNRNTI